MQQHPNNHPTRRNFVSLLAKLPLVACIPLGAQAAASSLTGSEGVPAKDMFVIKGTYINAAYTHPMSKGSYAEVRRFLNDRLCNRVEPKGYDGYERASVAAAFAKLINASADEIAWVPSTMVGENLVVHGLGLAGSKEHVVTDAYHFDGSLHMYNMLRQQGLQLTVVKPRNNRIDLNDLDATITPGTRLVAVSLVAAHTGYRHDLKKLCELAHARGALVYADIIQAAGAVPVDVRDTNVDFCACSTYKWLMGDFGIGFLYVRKDLLPAMKRTLIGFRQIKSFTTHFMPYDAPGESAFESTPEETMSGHFEVGTFANEGINALRYSLDFLNRTGVDKIHAYRATLTGHIQQQLAGHPKFIPLTPVDVVSPIVSFAYKNAATILKPKLDAADVSISVYDNFIRISPSIYNDMEDIERLLSVLKSA